MRIKPEATWARCGRAAIAGIASIGAFCAATAILSGCPGKLENPERFQTSGVCPDIPQLFATTCGTTGCHVGAAPAQGLDLASPGVEERIAGQPSTLCAGNTLADPDDPESSMIYTKLTPSPTCGSRMPQGKTPLSDFQAQCVLQWIETLEAAPPDDAGADDATDASN